MFKEEKLIPLQESGHHVIESEKLAGVHYIIKDNIIGITTYSRGSLTMELNAFRKMVAEALEVFDFWEVGKREA